MAKKPSRRRSSKRRSGSQHFSKEWLLILLLAGFAIVVLVLLSRWAEKPATPVARTPSVQNVLSQAQLEIEAFLSESKLASRDVHRKLATIPYRYQVLGKFPPRQDLKDLGVRLHQLSPSLDLTLSAENEMEVNLDGEALIVIYFAPVEPEPHAGPQVAIIMDDMGRGTHVAERLLSLPHPVTFSILPGEVHALQVARMGHEGGREIMLHVPMEPQGYPAVNPGDDALLLRYNDAEIRQRFITLLGKLPHVIGANNHMGSRFTEDRRAMGVVMEILREKGLFFVDSLTTGRSTATQVAGELRVPYLKRDVFLDNVAEVDAIKAQIEQLVKRAQNRGYAVGLCHPYPETLDALAEALPELTEKGVEVVPVSQLLTRKMNY